MSMRGKLFQSLGIDTYKLRDNSPKNANQTKDNDWFIIIHLQYLKIYNKKTGETRFESGSYISSCLLKSKSKSIASS